MYVYIYLYIHWNYKNSANALNSRVNIEKSRIDVHKDRSEEITQHESQRHRQKGWKYQAEVKRQRTKWEGWTYT